MVQAHQDVPVTDAVAVTVVLVDDVTVTMTVLGAKVVVVDAVVVTMSVFWQNPRIPQSPSCAGSLRPTRPSYRGAALLGDQYEPTSVIGRHGYARDARE